jgi:transcriptional regulator with XRE-family HTH domain
LRRDRGLSLQELSEITSDKHGINYRLGKVPLHHLEKGDRVATLADVLAIAAALEVAPLYLIFDPTAPEVDVLPGRKGTGLEGMNSLLDDRIGELQWAQKGHTLWTERLAVLAEHWAVEGLAVRWVPAHGSLSDLEDLNSNSRPVEAQVSGPEDKHTQAMFVRLGLRPQPLPKWDHAEDYAMTWNPSAIGNQVRIERQTLQALGVTLPRLPKAARETWGQYLDAFRAEVEHLENLQKRQRPGDAPTRWWDTTSTEVERLADHE